jgi:hypothetical protein
MPSSTSHKKPHSRGAHGSSGQGDGGSHDEGGGGGGGGGGKLVKVAFARNQSEAELLQGLLLDSGIPSVLKRSGGFDNPDFLAAGPHDVWVNLQHEEEAKRVLAETMVADEDEDEAEERLELKEERRLARGEGVGPSPGRLALGVTAAAIAAILLIWILYEIS